MVQPEVGYEMHAAALRNQLRNLMEKQAYENNYQDLDNPILDAYAKRSIATLAREGHLKGGKRNVGALARGGILRGIPYETIKRSLATLAKNGHLPSPVPSSKDEEDEEDSQSSEKRSIASLARSGNYMYDGKRSITSMVRNRLNSNQYDISPKRNLAALARQNMQGLHYGKRNVGNLARDFMLPQHDKTHNTDKREVKLSDIGKYFTFFYSVRS